MRRFFRKYKGVFIAIICIAIALAMILGSVAAFFL